MLWIFAISTSFSSFFGSLFEIRLLLPDFFIDGRDQAEDVVVPLYFFDRLIVKSFHILNPRYLSFIL